MKIKLLVIGKTTPEYLKDGIAEYEKRLVHYTGFSIEMLPDVKKAPIDKLKELEAEAFLKKITNRDFVVLLDENGKLFSSEKFAGQFEKWMNGQITQVVFIIGGAFGFGKALYDRANLQIALSEMTFSHQMVRLIFVEQLYRAFTIIKGEPYHHQ
jgi:23S rRNA (pseudouridine1915-N3)-methyltransferase